MLTAIDLKKKLIKKLKKKKSRERWCRIKKQQLSLSWKFISWNKSCWNRTHIYIYIFINNSLIHIRKKFEKFFKFFLFSLRIFDTHSKLEFQCLNTNTHTHKKAIKT